MEQLEFNEEDFFLDKYWLALFEQEPCLLIEYLERTYRNALMLELPALVKIVERLNNDKLLNYPNLQEVLVHLKLVNTSLLKHLLFEEAVLFDPIKKEKKESRNPTVEERESLKGLVGLLENEHTIVKEGFCRIRKLCKSYQVPLIDPVLPALYARIENCERLILKQMYLESHILFEKIILRNSSKRR